LVSAAIAALLVAASVGYFAIQRAGSSSTTPFIVTLSDRYDLHPSLDIQAAGNGTYRIHVRETGFARVYNLAAADQWFYPRESLYLFSRCGPPSPIGLAILQGHYGPSNLSEGKALTLYDTGVAYSCPTSVGPAARYLFSPSSKSTEAFDSNGVPMGNQSMTIDLLTSGYWTGGYGAGPPGPAQFHPFEGLYTVIAADEWGAGATWGFIVITTGLTLNLSLNASSIPVGHEIAFTTSLFNTRATENNVSSASNWGLPHLVMGPCGPTDSPIAFAVVQGFYTPLTISDARIQYGMGCTTVMGGVRFYLFQPVSNVASVFGSCSPNPCFTKPIVSSRSLNGYWSGNQYLSFTPGGYTVVVADEWGDFQVAHFTVQG